MNLFRNIPVESVFTGFSNEASIANAVKMVTPGSAFSSLPFLGTLDSDVRRSLDALIQSGQSRNDLVTFAVAKVIADVLPLDPSVRSSEASAYFNKNFRHHITMLLSKINELIILDIDQIVELSLNLYSFRLYCVEPGVKPLVQLNPEGEMDIFGTSKFLSKEMVDNVNCNGAIVSRHYHTFTFVGFLLLETIVKREQ